MLVLERREHWFLLACFRGCDTILALDWLSSINGSILPDEFLTLSFVAGHDIQSDTSISTSEHEGLLIMAVLHLEATS